MNFLRRLLKYSLRFVLFLIIAVLAIVIIIAFPVVSASTKMKSSEERISTFPDEGLPVSGSATIYWNEYLVPFIEASSDEDLAFLLGVINAHLRLGQMELLRMVAQGRLAEMGGPLATKIDHGLRILDIDKAVDKIIRNQDDQTRQWVQSYVDGINWYMDQMEEVPKEYKLLNIPRSKWEPRDVYSLARLASADLTWGIYIQALMNSKNEGWEQLWDFLIEKGQKTIPSYTVNAGEAVYQIFNHISKSGSNSLVVSGDKSFNGHALMANDPHLGIFAPNLWFLVGFKSPSFHLVGMQIPGIPFIGLGRNPDIAWGGTNMRSISSHMIELTEEQLENSTTYTDTIKVRFWFDKKVDIRVSEYGPVITDAPFLKHVDNPLAIQWLGHNGTNELRCFIEGSKARNFEEFRTAFKGYAVSGQNLVYADNQGNIGLIAAYTQPLLKEPDKTLDLVKSSDNAIIGGIDSYDLPYSFNPEKGFIASANNQPYPAKVPFSFEYSGYNRMQRMNDICSNNDSISIEMLVDMQTDVMSYQGLELKELIMEKTNGATGPMEGLNVSYWESFATWDGNYDVDSRGAVAFETMMYFFAATTIGKYYPEDYMKSFLMNDDRWLVLLPQLLKSESSEEVTERLLAAMKEGQKYFEKYDTWGDMHRLVFGSTLARIPVIGNKFKLADVGLGGSTNTLMKTAHPFTPEKHTISYGSNSRHISNMEDIDENYFVLLGGQDGWIKSPHNDDQLDLWLKREYIRMPLRLETVQKEFTYHISNIN